MWDKGFRSVAFAIIYDAIYWGDTFKHDVIDIDAIAQSYNAELTDKDKQKLEDLLQIFLQDKDRLYSQIEKYTNSWNKTYDIIKAIMCTAVLEYEEIKDMTTTEQKKKVVNKYVQIAQDMVGGNNPNLVFAIVGKLFGV